MSRRASQRREWLGWHALCGADAADIQHGSRTVATRWQAADEYRGTGGRRMSRQRHDSKRNDARTAPAAQRQRRQTPKSPQTARTNTRTNKGSNKTPHATQPSPQPSPQKSMKSTKAVKAPQTAKTLPQATTAATNAPKKRTDISASQSRATKAPTSKETAKSKKTAVSTTSAAAAIVAPVEMIAEASGRAS